MGNKVIIIDDDLQFIKLVEKFLYNSNLQLSYASSSNEAIKKLERDNYDLIICDLKMPGANGDKVVKFVNKNSNLIPIIVITGYPKMEEALKLMKMGVFDYLVKPIDKLKLTFTIKKAFETKKLIQQKKILEEKVNIFNERLEQLIEERTRELEKDYRKLKSNSLDSIRILSETIESKDPFTRGHCLRVSMYSIEIAKEFGFRNHNLEFLEIGSLLHDIGKIGLKGSILNKNGKLTKKEWSHVMKHPIIGESILQRIDFFKKILPIVRNHHERYNGKGYPDGLMGQEIPLESRIVCVVDAFDAMVSNRPYRNGLSREKAAERLLKSKGEQFDPDVVDIFIKKELYKKDISNRINIYNLEDLEKIVS